MKSLLAYIVIPLFIAAVVFIAVKKDKSNNKHDSADWKNIRCHVENPNDTYFNKYIPADFYDKIASGDFSRKIFPKFSDRKAWKKAAESKYAAMIIAEADKIPEKNVPQILFSHYSRYLVDGNRTELQGLYFQKRRNLSFLALALCLTGNKEKYMPRLLDHTVAVLEEYSWSLHAQMRWYYNQLRDILRTNLFNAETAAMMALLHHVLGEELDKEIENISEKIRTRALKETVYNIMYNPDSAVLHEWYVTPTPNNWLPWCSYNMLTTAVLLEKDTEKLAFYIREILRTNGRFAANYPEDGFCDEGASYCNEAGMMLFNIFHLMHKIRPESMNDIFAVPKIRAMFEFIAKVRIGKNHQICFGDSSPDYLPTIDRAAICGELLKSEMLVNVGNMRTASLRKSGGYLDTGLKLLFDMPETKNTALNKDEPFTYFKDRLGIIRSDKFSAAMKAGHNAESHNHNDLGNFTLYYDGEPLIVDAGTDTYTFINFSPQRYTLWYTRGSGHNAPVFGGVEQIQGREYTAKFIKADKNGFICDLSKAYSAEAGVKSFVRTLDFNMEKVIVEDKFELAKPREAVITLLSPHKAVKVNGKLRIGKVTVETDGIEFFEQKEMPKLANGKRWNGHLTAIRFKSNKNNYKFIFKGVEK